MYIRRVLASPHIYSSLHLLFHPSPVLIIINILFQCVKMIVVEALISIQTKTKKLAKSKAVRPRGN